MIKLAVHGFRGNYKTEGDSEVDASMMLMRILFVVIVASLTFASAKADGAFDWIRAVVGWDDFLDKYAVEKQRCEIAAAYVSKLSADYEAEDKKYAYSPKAESLTIGEFETTKEFQERVERQKDIDRKEEAKVSNQRKLMKEKIEYGKQEFLRQQQECQKRLYDCVYAFTNRLRTVYFSLGADSLPYFDRDSMSFRDIANPFYTPGNVSYKDKERKVKFAVNSDRDDYNLVSWKKDFNEYEGDEIDGYRGREYSECDTFTYWQGSRRLNVNVDEKISLKFKSLADAGRLKKSVSSGETVLWLCCEFKVGLPAEWIISHGHYERVIIDGGALVGILNAIKYGVDSSKIYTEQYKWHPAVIGKVVPIQIQSSKVIVEGCPVQSVPFEVVSSTGTWSAEKCEMGTLTNSK